MCGSTHTFRKHQGVELMSYGSNGNELDRIAGRLQKWNMSAHFSRRQA